MPLPIERIVEATPRLVTAARADGLDDFTRAIMTTDRFEKRALQLLPLGPKTRARVVGVCKGAKAPCRSGQRKLRNIKRSGRLSRFGQSFVRRSSQVLLP
jgi:hypothetical protein